MVWNHCCTDAVIAVTPNKLVGILLADHLTTSTAVDPSQNISCLHKLEAID
jgi:hypothetical protein